MPTHDTVPLSIAITPRMHPRKASVLARRIEPGWQHDGACLDAKQPDSWFPEPGDNPADTAAAVATCARCPAARSCLAAGILGDEHGIWGGTGQERRRDARLRIGRGAPVDAELDDLLNELDEIVDTLARTRGRGLRRRVA